MNQLQKYIKNNIRLLSQLKNIPNIKTGDTVKIHNKLIEKENIRKQIFEGECLAIYNKGIASSIKLKKITKNLIIEKNFPIYSPNIEKIEIISRGKVRRSKLYYIRHNIGKAARIKKK